MVDSGGAPVAPVGPVGPVAPTRPEPGPIQYPEELITGVVLTVKPFSITKLFAVAKVHFPLLV